MILRFGRFRWNEISLRILWKSFQKREEERVLRKDRPVSIMGTWIFGFRNYCGKNILSFSNFSLSRIESLILQFGKFKYNLSFT